MTTDTELELWFAQAAGRVGRAFRLQELQGSVPHRPAHLAPNDRMKYFLRTLRACVAELQKRMTAEPPVVIQGGTTEQQKVAAYDLVADHTLLLADACGLDQSDSCRLVTEAWEAFDVTWGRPHNGVAPRRIDKALRDATSQLTRLIELLEERPSVSGGDGNDPVEDQRGARAPAGNKDGDAGANGNDSAEDQRPAGARAGTNGSKAAGGGRGSGLADAPARKILETGLKIFALAASAVGIFLAGWDVPVAQNLLASTIGWLASSLTDQLGHSQQRVHSSEQVKDQQEELKFKDEADKGLGGDEPNKGLGKDEPDTGLGRYLGL